MLLLHTSDWHVGLTIGAARHDRTAEIATVLKEIVEIASERRPDVVVIAGDLYERAVPTAEAERLVNETVVALAGTGADVVVLAGNHDDAVRLAAVRPYADRLSERVHLVCDPVADAAPIRVTRGADTLTIVALPFVSQRLAVEWERRDEAHAAYGHRVASVLEQRVEDADTGGPIVVAGHLFCEAAELGAGERLTTVSIDYSVDPARLPTGPVVYGALGHVHRAQAVSQNPLYHYSGSIVAADFSESAQRKQVNLVEIARRGAARVEAVPLTRARPLRRLRVALGEIDALTGQHDDAWVELTVHAPTWEPGIAERARNAIPGVVKLVLEIDRAEDTVTPDEVDLLDVERMYREYRAAGKKGEPAPELVDRLRRLLVEVER
jgi:exonuclease SbcD